MTPPRLSDASTLGLCRFVVKGRGDRYSVIQRESRQAVSTSKVGLEAIRLLAAGRTLQDTRGVLGERHGVPADRVDLTPLLETLFASGFVQTLDGRPIAPHRAPTRRRFRAWLALLVWSPLLELALRYLPLRLAVPFAHRWFTQDPDRALVARVAANVRRAPALGHSGDTSRRIAADNAQALRRQVCDRLLLGALPPRRARRWLADVRVSGLEHLAGSIARGKGTILCSFHMGSYGLLPFVLGARGVALTMYVGFGADTRADVAAWLTERARRRDHYPVRIAGGGMGLRTLVRGLARGDTVLFFCDRAPDDHGDERGDAHRRLRVPFLGTRVWSARGLGWLHARSGAAVLPTVLLWEGRRRHLHIGSAIADDPAAHGAADAATVVAAAYTALEAFVRRAPAQWLKWEQLAGMIAP